MAAEAVEQPLSVTVILSGFSATPYRWGRSDCVRVVHAVLGRYYQIVLPDWYREYQYKPEREAVAHATTTHGSVAEAYAHYIRQYPDKIEVFTPDVVGSRAQPFSVRVGDVLLFDAPAKVMGVQVSPVLKADIVVVVDRTYELLTYTPFGLRPVQTHPREAKYVFRAKEPI